MKDEKVKNVKVDESSKTEEVKKVEETQEEKDKKAWDETRQAIPLSPCKRTVSSAQNHIYFRRI